MADFKEHIKTRRYFYGVLIAIIAFVIISGVIRETRALSGPSGLLTVVNVPNGAVLSLNGKVIQTVKEGESTVTVNSEPGRYTVSVERLNHFPWQKTIEVKEGQETTVFPFLLHRSPLLSVSPAGPEESESAATAFKTTAPSKTAPAYSVAGDVALWRDGNNIIASWIATSTPPQYFCSDTSCSATSTVVATFTEAPTYVAFLGNRSDIVVFSVASGVFALELDMRDIQNFQPIKDEHGTDVRPRDEKTLYLKNGGIVSIYTIDSGPGL